MALEQFGRAFSSEFLHSLRRYQHPEIRWDEYAKNLRYLRNEKAVKRLFLGFVNLIFPGVQIGKDNLQLILNLACELRQNVYNQLNFLDSDEFGPLTLSVQVK